MIFLFCEFGSSLVSGLQNQKSHGPELLRCDPETKLGSFLGSILVQHIYVDNGDTPRIR